MNLPVFYIQPDKISGETAVLDKTESHHAVKVLRLKTGNLLMIIDGEGKAYRSEISKLNRSGIVELRINAQIRNFGEPEVKLTLISGLSTGYKFDTVIEKGTELGVTRFVPLLSEKSKIKLDDPKRIKTKLSRYNKVALAAVKQSRRSYLPQISTPVSFKQMLGRLDKNDINLLFDVSRSRITLNDRLIGGDIKRITLIVGPESGFTPDELEAAETAGVHIVGLGKRVLRTETAGPAVAAIVMFLLGELS